MSRIRAKNSKPELLVRSFLFAKGFRYRLHDNKLPGKPDIVLPKYKTAIFVNGCFWHGHERCKYYVLPKTRTDWWQKKIAETKVRDSLNIEKLNELGLNVLTIYECQLRPVLKSETFDLLLRQLSNE